MGSGYLLKPGVPLQLNRGLEHVNEVIVLEFWLLLWKHALRVSF